MAEEKSSGGWFKAVIGTVTGLLGGAAMMYVTPLVDSVIKPSKPLANFALESNGLQVTFQNRSAGTEGFWDFGDGTALEPVNMAVPSVSHTFPKPGSYTVKLTVRNFLGDENERSVPVEVKAADAGAPAVVALEAIPASAQNFAPAMFRLTGKAQNAATVIWECGDESAAEAIVDPSKSLERTVTLSKPGTYNLNLLAIKDGQPLAKRTVAVQVLAPPSNVLMGVLHTTDQGLKVQVAQGVDHVTLLPGPKDQPFEKTLAARPGFVLTEVKVSERELPGGVRNVAIQVAPDRRSAVVRGELAAASGKSGGVGVAFVPLNVRQERRTPTARRPLVNAKQLQVPGSTTIPLANLPSDWVSPQRQVRLELRDGADKVWPEGPLPRGAQIYWAGRRFSVNAVQVGEQVRIDVSEVKAGNGISAN